MKRKVIPEPFWDGETELLFRVLFPEISAMVKAAAKTAGEELEIATGIALDWELINSQALDWAKVYTYEKVHDITVTTRDFISKELQTWIQSGGPLQDLMDALAGDVYSDYRAFMIATTEVTRAYTEGNLDAWRISGVVSGKQWFTAEDDIVCDICGPLDGSTIGLEEEGYKGYLDEMVGGPPAHVNCRCWLQPIVEK